MKKNMKKYLQLYFHCAIIETVGEANRGYPKETLQFKGYIHTGDRGRSVLRVYTETGEDINYNRGEKDETMIHIDVYYDRRRHDGAYVVEAWDSKDSMYPALWNNQFIGYTLTEVKRLVRERIHEKYDKYYDRIAFHWHDKGEA